ncbi:MAG: hypothetical protein BGN88_12725 [Clostridiales bacterium 43-6]|nr:MAG: hypothetical protein BGN88_12725 [Clostridiales bacterium 43-6]
MFKALYHLGDKNRICPKNNIIIRFYPCEGLDGCNQNDYDQTRQDKYFEFMMIPEIIQLFKKGGFFYTNRN